jgi:hypothetical protein
MLGMRKCWVGLLVGVTAVSLAACGSDDSDAESSAEDQTTTTTRAASTTTAPSDEYEYTTPSGKTVMVSRKQVEAVKAWTAKMDPDGVLGPAEACLDWEMLALIVNQDPLADGSYGMAETQQIATVVKRDIAEPPCGVQVSIGQGLAGGPAFVFAAG